MFEAPTITVVGHALGAALALLDAVYLKVQLGSSVNIQMVGYGMPRVGNDHFADWVDGNLAVDGNLNGLVTRINNKEDPVPTVPPLYEDFHHVSGEVHITDSGTWESCSGKLFSSWSSPRPVCGHVCFVFRMLTRARGSLLIAGQDNGDLRCSGGDVPNVSEGNKSDNDGPYNGIMMGCGAN